jgi:hypothetical protein
LTYEVEGFATPKFLVKGAVVGSQLFIELLPSVNFGQGLHPGEGPGREELGGDEILGGRFDDVSQMEVSIYLVDPGSRVSGRPEKGVMLAAL